MSKGGEQYETKYYFGWNTARKLYRDLYRVRDKVGAIR